jgi:hypothetical protein
MFEAAVWHTNGELTILRAIDILIGTDIESITTCMSSAP